MTGKHDTQEAVEPVREEGAPQGAPEPAHAPQGAPEPAHAVPAGDPEAPVGPVASVESGSVAAEDHERQLEHDLEELTARAEKADEYLELAKRTKADFENYRKRAAREAAAAQERGMARLAKELLPAVDNLDRALQAAQSVAEPGAEATGQADNGTTATLVSGIKLVHDDVIAALARAGIEPFSPQGERFDPQFHEAIAQQPVEGAQSGTVVEVYQRGYRLGEVVIRPARVVVAA
jgi:molecular chaperone GrpE